MIFSSLAKFIKSRMHGDKPIINLLPLWMRLKLKEQPARDNAAKIIQAEFKLQEMESSHIFFIVPKTNRALHLLKLLREYINVMESTRFSRWVERVKPKDFEEVGSKKDNY